MTKDEALEMCLEYIETNALERRFVRWAIKEALAQPDEDAIIIQYHEATIKILEKRIEELTAQPERGPVARVIDNGTPEGATEWIPFTNRVEPLKTGDLLYTTPPQRPWVGLTGDEISSCDPYEEIWDLFEIARKLEAKLKEKNA